MTSQTSFHGCKPQDVADFLRAATESPGLLADPADRDKAILLLSHLAACLPHAPVCRLQNQPGDPLAAEPPRSDDPTIGDLLTDPVTPVEQLLKVKEYGRNLDSHSGSDTMHAVGLALYFGAIAAALLFHGQSITSYGGPELAHSCRTLASKEWMAVELAELLEKAASVS